MRRVISIRYVEALYHRDGTQCNRQEVSRCHLANTNEVYEQGLRVIKSLLLTPSPLRYLP